MHVLRHLKRTEACICQTDNLPISTYYTVGLSFSYLERHSGQAALTRVLANTPGEYYCPRFASCFFAGVQTLIPLWLIASHCLRRWQIQLASTAIATITIVSAAVCLHLTAVIFNCRSPKWRSRVAWVSQPSNTGVHSYS